MTGSAFVAEGRRIFFVILVRCRLGWLPQFGPFLSLIPKGDKKKISRKKDRGGRKNTNAAKHHAACFELGTTDNIQQMTDRYSTARNRAPAHAKIAAIKPGKIRVSNTRSTKSNAGRTSDRDLSPLRRRPPTQQARRSTKSSTAPRPFTLALPRRPLSCPTEAASLCGRQIRPNS